MREKLAYRKRVSFIIALMTDKRLTKSIFKHHLLNALLVLLIPGFSAWFFKNAEQQMDQNVLMQIEKDISSDTRSTELEKQRSRDFFRAAPASKILASSSPEVAELQAMFAPLKSAYDVFRWMQRLAWICLGTVLATFLLVGMSIACSFKSNVAQYWSLRIGWPILRTSAVIQVLGQAVLAVFLSYWVTALFLEIYVLKLILAIAVLAACGVWALIIAMFRKVDKQFEIAGQVLDEQSAPTLWQHIRALAVRLDTAAPDRIVVGIEPSFYVTENPVMLNRVMHEGRTLYLSLPMLKILSMEEADAILGHELAHFSGQDTLWSCKIAPLLGRFGLYLQMLSTGAAVPVARFLSIFWDLYMLSIRKLSRKREFRADTIGSSLTTPAAMTRALIKVSGYCEYRAKTENQIIEHNRLHTELRLAEKLSAGFPGFLTAFISNENAAFAELPHPFDTHPSLNQRLGNLDVNPTLALKEEALRSPVASTWQDVIPTAQALEEAMWSEREQLIQSFHSQDLAWRLLPGGAEEEALVLTHFPKMIFLKKDGAEATLEYDRIHLPNWDAPLLFKHIEGASLETELTKQRLTLSSRSGEKAKVLILKCHPTDFVHADGNLLVMFERYYGRHKHALLHAQQKKTHATQPRSH